MSQVFLSHVDEDRSFVDAIAVGLERAGYSTWYFERDAHTPIPDTRPGAEIAQAIEQAEVVAVLISLQSLQNPGRMLWEIDHARKYRRRLVPLLFGVAWNKVTTEHPDLAFAFEGAVALVLTVPPDRPADVLPRIIGGLQALAVRPWDPKTQPVVHVRSYSSPFPDAPAPRPDEDDAVELPPAIASAVRSSAASPSSPRLDAVDCTVFAPPTAARGTAIMVQVFAHTPEQSEPAAAVAREFDLDAQRRGVASVEVQVIEGARLTIDLGIPGLEIDECVQALVWRRRPGSVQFGVRVPDDHELGTVIGTVTVSLADVPVGHVKFKLEIVRGEDAGLAEPEPRGEDAHRYSMAFISYASTDRAEVLRRVQMLTALGIRYFQDILHLDPGERWEEKLYERIDDCDLFLLFWSTAAKESEWVKKEVEYALERQHDDPFAPPEIRPIIVEGPPTVVPWESLSHLHFNDFLIYLIGAAQE